MVWYAVLYPPAEEELLTSSGAEFIGPRYPSRQKALDALTPEWALAAEDGLPLAPYVIESTSDGNRIERIDSGELDAPRQDNPVLNDQQTTYLRKMRRHGIMRPTDFSADQDEMVADLVASGHVDYFEQDGVLYVVASSGFDRVAS